jgi:hypothetical protein
MDTFRWISVTISMILGLGVARLLTGTVAVFHVRHRVKIDWLPLVWAASIFVQHIDFWWSLQELSVLVPKWWLGGFFLLVGLTLSLFLAAALVLPSSTIAEEESLRGFFEHDGRWALLALSIFNALAIVANTVLWSESLLSASSALNLVLSVLPIIALLGSRRVLAAITLAYLVVSLLAVGYFSPASY